MSATITPLPFKNVIVARHPLREEISILSSGGCYDSPQRWYRKAANRCEYHYYHLGEMPQLHVACDEQLDPFYLPLYRGGEQVGAIMMCIYRRSTGNWEIVAYVV